MKIQVRNEDTSCPECGGALITGVDVGDGFIHDICGGYDGCGFKRKKKKIDEQGDAKN